MARLSRMRGPQPLAVQAQQRGQMGQAAASPNATATPDAHNEEMENLNKDIEQFDKYIALLAQIMEGDLEKCEDNPMHRQILTKRDTAKHKLHDHMPELTGAGRIQKLSDLQKQRGVNEAQAMKTKKANDEHDDKILALQDLMTANHTNIFNRRTEQEGIDTEILKFSS